jgi:quercetin dioxygenase-like cupin family protein
MLREGFGILYWFHRRGEGLPLHSHEPPLDHDIFVTSGRFKVVIDHGDGFPSLWYLGEGSTVALPPGKGHEIVALDDGSSFIAHLTHGRPFAYAALPESERCVEVQLGPLRYPLNEND